MLALYNNNNNNDKNNNNNNNINLHYAIVHYTILALKNLALYITRILAAYNICSAQS